jgi:hypothetical protein
MRKDLRIKCVSLAMELESAVSVNTVEVVDLSDKMACFFANGMAYYNSKEALNNTELRV